jgi:hypothetical protein
MINFHKANCKFNEAKLNTKFIIIENLFGKPNTVMQAWAKKKYMRAMIYLNIKLHARAENLYNSPVYSLDFYPSTKFFWDQHVT